jgi:hypothetical protein
MIDHYDNVRLIECKECNKSFKMDVSYPGQSSVKYCDECFNKFFPHSKVHLELERNFNDERMVKLWEKYHYTKITRKDERPSMGIGKMVIYHIPGDLLKHVDDATKEWYKRLDGSLVEIANPNYIEELKSYYKDKIPFL